MGTALLLVFLYSATGHYLHQWYSGTNGIRDSLLFSSLWLIPVFLFPKRIKIIAAVIGVVLWAASLAALCYYVIYGQEFSQSVLFVMFETNTNEASEYLSQYFSLKIVLIALAIRRWQFCCGHACARSIFQSRGVMLSLLPCFMA
ncbi:inner membrane protein [Escherichia coli]|uniref:Inner membrane protein n=1 Tax=Escherichia coli TaxID=562 RepID=A0A377BNQ1_ECOLX|nr:inner membrane protein [Escherichia coli]